MFAPDRLLRRACERARSHAAAGNSRRAIQWFEIAMRRAAPLQGAASDGLLDVARALTTNDTDDVSLVHEIVESQFRALAFADRYGGASTFPRVMVMDASSLFLRRLGRLREAVGLGSEAARLCVQHGASWPGSARMVVRNAVSVMIDFSLFAKALPLAEWNVAQERSSSTAAGVIDLYQLGRCHLGVGRTAEAESLLSEALRARDARRPPSAERKLDVVANEIESWLSAAVDASGAAATSGDIT